MATLNRREFLKFAGAAATAASMAELTGGVTGLLFRLYQRAGIVSRDFGSSSFVYGVDPEEIRNDLFDPFADGQNLVPPEALQVINDMTGGNNGFLSYQQFTQEIMTADTLLLGEPHFEDGDKIADGEIIRAITHSNPNRKMVVTLGRFSPDDDNALHNFIFNLPDLDDKKALDWLLNNTSWEESYWLKGDIVPEPGTRGEFGKLLLMLRHQKIEVRGLGVDRAIIKTSPDGSLPNKDEEYRQREQEAAKRLFDIEGEYPNGILVSIAGRPHVARGGGGGGIIPKLETLRDEDKTPAIRRTISVNFSSGFADGPAWDRFKAATQRRLPTDNFVMVTRKPNFSSYHWVKQNSEELVRQFPGSDYLITRFVK